MDAIALVARSHHHSAFDGYEDDQDDEHPHLAPAAFLEDMRFSPAQQLENADWSEQSNDIMYRAIHQLDERSQDIIRARWLDDDKITLQDLAAKYQISAERVRQLEQQAMKKLRMAFEE